MALNTNNDLHPSDPPRLIVWIDRVLVFTAKFGLEVGAGLWCAFVRSCLWLWFFVPVLHVPVFNTIQMYALTFFVTSITFRTPYEQERAVKMDRETRNSWNMLLSRIFESALMWALILGIGYALHRFAIHFVF